MPIHPCATNHRWLIAACLGLGLWILGCTAGAPLNVEISGAKDVITPDARGDRMSVSYRLTRPAQVSISVRGSVGIAYPLRERVPRRANETYVYSFDGTVPESTAPERRRVLPDGPYELQVTATDATGQTQQRVHAFQIRDADTSPPEIENLSVFPPIISPNFDGVDDVATVSFRLTKRSRVQRLVLDSSGSRVYVGGAEVLEPGEYAERWDGTAREKPAPDGEYRYQVRATDAAGNLTQVEAPVAVAASGRPEGRILRVDFTPRRLMVGEVLTVRALVRNTGTLPLNSGGPEPGYAYSSFDSFGSIANHQFIDRLGSWRVGVDWAGSPTSTGSKYPYRWGFNGDLLPGQEAIVEGRLRVEHGPALDRQVGPLNNRIFVYAGLIHEGIAFFDDRVGGTWIEIGY